MIGDWVKMRLPDNSYTEIDQLESVDAVLHGKLIAEPIPLTQEILKANGFEEYRDGVYNLTRYRYITDTDTIIIEPMRIESRLGSKWYWFSNKDREMEVVKPRIVYPFTCIHELQHALRLCGLNCLADNFKV